MGFRDFISGNGPDRDELQSHIPNSNKGNTVSEKAVKKTFDLLVEGEQVHYYANAFDANLRDEEYGMSDSLYNRIIATDRRVGIKISHYIKHDRTYISYDNITSVSVNTSHLELNELDIVTQNGAYKFTISKPRGDELKDMAQFIRLKMDEPNHQPVSNSQEAEDDPLEQIEKLKDLHEKGAITKSEFEEKKSELLDQI